jgi:hypothetical protein
MNQLIGQVDRLVKGHKPIHDGHDLWMAIRRFLAPCNAVGAGERVVSHIQEGGFGEVARRTLEGPSGRDQLTPAIPAVTAFDEFPRLPAVYDPRAAVRANWPRQSELGLVDVEMHLGNPICLDRIAAGLEHNVSTPPGVALSTREWRGRFVATERRWDGEGRVDT